MEKSVRFSKKRDAVYSVLTSTKTHPNAEWIYSRVKDKYPDISLGTVYRNLTMFRENGSAVCVCVVNGQERYDGNTSPHSHFVCRVCGAVIDVPEKSEKEEGSGGGLIEGIGRVESRELIYRGVCTDCMKKEYTEKV